jgi:hypothetical protein
MSLTDKLQRAKAAKMAGTEAPRPPSATPDESEAPREEKKIPSPPSIIGLIEQVLDSAKVRHKFFRPSGLFGCDRANVFHACDAPANLPDIGNQLQRILDEGTAIHKVVQNYLADHPGIYFAPESRVHHEVPGGGLIRGSCDGVLIRRGDGYRWGLELKTINDDGFRNITERPLPPMNEINTLDDTIEKAPDGFWISSRGNRVDGPHKSNSAAENRLRGLRTFQKHAFQACVYGLLHKLGWVTIVYWNKNNQKLAEYPVEVAGEMENAVNRRVIHLQQYVDQNKLPAYDQDTCDTSFCRYVVYCRAKGAPV